MNSPIIFDIETIPDRLTEYNQAFPKSKKKAGIHAIISRVVAIGYDLGGCRKVIMGEEEEIVTYPPMNWRACLYTKSREAYGRVTLLPD